ncbi:MAG: outer membrane protein assembly factor BamD [Rickettsiales bacterium]|nr:outer membrane protein assembly factor BamD [Rickettsiales bacterium]
MKIIQKLFLLLALTTLAFSCSKKDDKTGAEISYTKAAKLLKDKSYSEAADAFEKIDSDFPFSKWAVKGQTMAIYARYKDEDYTKLLSISDDFLRLNPSSEYVPYVLYMKGLSYYNQIPSIERAQDNTQQASFIFRELIARFPADDHTDDAREKLSFIDEHLAGAKMSVGRYQIKNKNYIGAIENFRDVILRYRQTNQVPEAYFRITEIYYKLGLKDEGQKAFKKLNGNFPENYWTGRATKIVSQ